jgi:hypothetical protein
MKKLVSTLFILLGLVTFSFAQEAHTIAVSNGAEALNSSKVSGDYEFTLPSTLTEEQVVKNASYYTSILTVTFDKGSNKASIHMLSNEQKDRYVLARFLTACKIQHVKVGDDTVELYDFIEKFLK